MTESDNDAVEKCLYSKTARTTREKKEEKKTKQVGRTKLRGGDGCCRWKRAMRRSASNGQRHCAPLAGAAWRMHSFFPDIKLIAHLFVRPVRVRARPRQRVVAVPNSTRFLFVPPPVAHCLLIKRGFSKFRLAWPSILFHNPNRARPSTLRLIQKEEK